MAAIAELEGLEEFYTRKATRRIAAALGIDYVPNKQPLGSNLTAETRRLRDHLAGILYSFRNARGRHPLEVARETGLTQAQQVMASQTTSVVGYVHDYKLSQLERIAAASDQSFKHMMLRGLLTPDEWQKVQRCLTS